MNTIRRLYAMAKILNFWRYAVPLFVGVGLAVLWQASHPGAALSYDTMAPVEQLVVRGDRLEIYVKGAYRNRICPETTYRYLSRDVTGPEGKTVPLIVPLADRAPPISVLGKHDFIISLSIPGNITAGVWEYQMMWIRSCSTFRWFDPAITVSTPIDIPVRDPTASDNAPIIVDPTPLTIVPESASR